MMKYFHPLKNTLHVKLYYRVPPKKDGGWGTRRASPSCGGYTLLITNYMFLN